MDALSKHRASGRIAGPPRVWPARRVAGLLTGLALLVGAVAMIGAGAFAVVAGSDGTYVDLGGHGSYRTDRYGLATDRTNWRSSFLGWAGSVRLMVASAGGRPIFVGVAAPDAVSRYLSGTGYTTVAEHSGHVVRTDHDGGAPAIPPAAAVDWTAHAEGIGTQTLRWKATDDPQVAFAMNADGSPAVRVRIVSSAVTLDRMPWWVPAGLLALGVGLLPAGIVMLRRTIRTRRVVP
jgi:hypothetical protein